MKARLFIVFVLVVGLALFLAWAVTAQGAEIKAGVQSTLNINSTNHNTELYSIRQNEVNLGSTSEITFTPAFTVYLPSVQRTVLPSLCSTAPTLISPTNGNLLNTLIPVLTYMRGTASVSYTVISIADNPAFDTPISYSTSGGGLGPFQLRLFHNLQPATTYYWRVQDKCGSVYSPYSPVFSFITGSGGVVLLAPELVSPVSGTLGLGQQVTVTWNSVVGAVGYQVWRKQVGPYGGWLYFVPGNSLVLGNFQPNTTYEWWVVAYNDYAYGIPSDKWLFSTGSFTFLQEDTSPKPEEIYDQYYSVDWLIQSKIDDH